MTKLPEDPLKGSSIAEFGARLRRGEITSESATLAYLARSERLEPHLRAFTHVASEQALRVARGVDVLLAGGVDLGPLMGVPVAVKDLFTVDGMPLPKVGSKLDIHDLIEPEGPFITKMKRAGCVILGKTRMTEFAFGLVNLTEKPPWNPWDADVHRMPGGSSGGSAVALASGLCAISFGTDTGGSVRQPAALCGVYGFKATAGLWPTSGVFPLSPTFDSLGFFARSAEDAAVVFAALTGEPVPEAKPPQGMRLGRPTNHYFDDLSPAVKQSVEEALSALESSGVEIVSVDVPEVSETNDVIVPIMATELLAQLGRKRVESGKAVIDPIVWSRLQTAFELSAVDYIGQLNRQKHLRRIAYERMRGLDGWICPTTFSTAIPVEECQTVEEAIAWTHKSTRNTRPGNLFGQCGTSIPVWCSGVELPIGLQVMCAPGHEATLLSISQGISRLLPKPHLLLEPFNR